MRPNMLLTSPIAAALRSLKLRRCVSCIKRYYGDTCNPRVRFAPSPTGELHLGGLRTALYNYLFARQNNGVFILRCEDTDQDRLVSGAMERMIEILDWMGMKPDEGPLIGGDYGPYKQSERINLYREWTDHLIAEGHAYRCFCSPLRLELLRKEQANRRETLQGYDNCCRALSEGKMQENLENRVPHVVRFKLGEDGLRWNDLVYGECTSDTGYIEGDPVILKSDGYPTYHLANVVDDHLMKITHVLRGGEWQTSTFKHLQLYKAFGWTPPEYAHLPLLLNSDGTKLSKRHEGLRIQNLRDDGYEQEALLALLCINGGGVQISHTEINEMGVTMQQAIKKFSVNCISTQSSSLAMDRLPTLNNTVIIRQYQAQSKETFCERIKKQAIDSGVMIDEERLIATVDKLYTMFPKYSERIKMLKDFMEGDFSFIWTRPSLDSISALSSERFLPHTDTVRLLELVKSTIDTDGVQEEIVDKLWKMSGVKKRLFFSTLRLAFVGKEAGIPVAMVFDLLDAQELSDRCESVLAYLRKDIVSEGG